MKKLLFLAVLLLAACQKDYYLEDLQQAEFEIQQLQSISDAKTDEINNLQEIINTINADLNAAQEHIVAITSDLAEVNKERDLLQIDVDRLVGIVVNKEEEIDSLLAQTEVDSLAIANLNDEVASLETALANVETIAANRLDRITELENAEPTVVTVTRTQVVYRDREVVRWLPAVTPATPETGVTYSEEGSRATNLDTTDCAGGALARLVSNNTLLSISISPGNVSNCDDMGVEVLRNQTVVASNTNHYVVNVSPSDFQTGEIVTVRATGPSSFTTTLTIPTLPDTGQNTDTMEAAVDPCVGTTAAGIVANEIYTVTITPVSGCSITKIKVGSNHIGTGLTQGVNYVSAATVSVTGYDSDDTPIWTGTLTMPVSQVSSDTGSNSGVSSDTGSNSGVASNTMENSDDESNSFDCDSVGYVVDGASLFFSWDCTGWESVAVLKDGAIINGAGQVETGGFNNLSFLHQPELSNGDEIVLVFYDYVGDYTDPKYSKTFTVAGLPDPPTPAELLSDTSSAITATISGSVITLSGISTDFQDEYQGYTILYDQDDPADGIQPDEGISFFSGLTADIDPSNMNLHSGLTTGDTIRIIFYTGTEVNASNYIGEVDKVLQ